MAGDPVPAELPSGPRPFSWSASRHDTFASCRRRYYYSYYASLEDEEIRRLKKLSALPLWAGSVVHETIEQFLRDHDALPSPERRRAAILGAGVANVILLPDLDGHLGPVLDVVVDALEEPVEELALLLHIFELVEVPPLLAPVDQQPFVFGRDLLEAFP